MSFISTKKKYKYNGFTSVSHLSQDIIKPIYKKFGIIDSKLITHWEDIVGKDLAKKLLPAKISTTRQGNRYIKILYIESSDPSVAFTLNYQKTTMLRNISAYLGNLVIDDIRVMPSNFEVKSNLVEDAPLSLKNIELKTYIEDEELKAALESLGSFVASKS